MKKNLRQAMTLAAGLALAAAAPVSAADHGSHGSHGNHGSHTAAAPSPGATTSARHGAEIRKTVVSGHTLSYHLIDMNQMMASSSMPMTHGGEKMKSHHLMVYPVAPDGKPALGGKVGYLVTAPDKSDAKVMAMLMDDGFGADVDLAARGDYKIVTKIALGKTTLVDEFVYTVK